MNGPLDLLIYLDESLTKNLNSLVISGYIEKRTSKWIEDRTLSGNIRFNDKEQYYEEDRCMKDERDGYKGKNYTNADTLTDSNEIGRGVEGRRLVRREEELTRIYTTFELHKQLIDGLSNNNYLKTIDSNWQGENIQVGDYIQISGIISSNSIKSYIDAYANVINCYGCSSLNSAMIPNSTDNVNTALNYDVVLNQLNYVKSLMDVNNTQDVIIKTDYNDILITINNEYFINSYGNIFEKDGCPCKVIGKVIKVCNSNDHIHLLRKTGQPQYFEKVLDGCSCLHDHLQSMSIEVPSNPGYKVTGETIQILPISLCI